MAKNQRLEEVVFRAFCITYGTETNVGRPDGPNIESPEYKNIVSKMVGLIQMHEKGDKKILLKECVNFNKEINDLLSKNLEIREIYGRQMKRLTESYLQLNKNTFGLHSKVYEVAKNDYVDNQKINFDKLLDIPEQLLR